MQLARGGAPTPSANVAAAAGEGTQLEELRGAGDGEDAEPEIDHGGC